MLYPVQKKQACEKKPNKPLVMDEQTVSLLVHRKVACCIQEKRDLLLSSQHPGSKPWRCGLCHPSSCSVWLQWIGQGVEKLCPGSRQALVSLWPVGRHEEGSHLELAFPLSLEDVLLSATSGSIFGDGNAHTERKHS